MLFSIVPGVVIRFHSRRIEGVRVPSECQVDFAPFKFMLHFSYHMEFRQVIMSWGIFFLIVPIFLLCLYVRLFPAVQRFGRSIAEVLVRLFLSGIAEDIFDEEGLPLLTSAHVAGLISTAETLSQ